MLDLPSVLYMVPHLLRRPTVRTHFVLDWICIRLIFAIVDSHHFVKHFVKHWVCLTNRVPYDNVGYANQPVSSETSPKRRTAVLLKQA